MLCALGAGVYLARHRLAGLAAPFLFLSETPQRADLIYVLGGDYDVRGRLAAQLVREGWADRILLAREADDAKLRQNQTDLLARRITEAGVATGKLTELTTAGGVKSTADEAEALRLYLQKYPSRAVIVVTSRFHGRRARLAFRRALHGSGTRLTVVTADSHFASEDSWRTNAIGRRTIELECVKLIYYFLFFWG